MTSSTGHPPHRLPEGERVGVIGAGPAGLAAAYTLARHGVPADVFEAEDSVGGMAKTIRLWGQRVDLGPHRFFSADARVNGLWREVVGPGYRVVNRLTRIYYGGRLIAYPLRLSDALARLGPAEALRCLASWLRGRLERRPPARTFEEWVSARFGKRLYEIFFRTYSEKVWGIPCTRIDAGFAAQRIRGFSAFEALRNAVTGGRGNRHATLADRFAYPLGGTGSVYAAMAEAIRTQGGSIHLGAPVRGIARRTDGRLELEFPSGAPRAYRQVVSCMPLTRLMHALPGVPAAVRAAASALRYRSTILVYLRVAARGIFPDQWIYVHSPDLEVGRITNYRNWIPELCGDSPDTILSLELWCDPGDARWREPDGRHIARAAENLQRTGLIGNAAVTGGHVVRIPFCYPVYDLGYQVHLGILRDYLETVPGLHAIGRCGAFSYNNQDHSLLAGILAGEKIALGRAHDLWDVNTGEDYQEAAAVDNTGLGAGPR